MLSQKILNFFPDCVNESRIIRFIKFFLIIFTFSLAITFSPWIQKGLLAQETTLKLSSANSAEKTRPLSRNPTAFLSAKQITININSNLERINILAQQHRDITNEYLSFMKAKRSKTVTGGGQATETSSEIKSSGRYVILATRSNETNRSLQSELDRLILNANKLKEEVQKLKTEPNLNREEILSLRSGVIQCQKALNKLSAHFKTGHEEDCYSNLTYTGCKDCCNQKYGKDTSETSPYGFCMHSCMTAEANRILDRASKQMEETSRDLCRLEGVRCEEGTSESSSSSGGSGGSRSGGGHDGWPPKRMK